MDIIKSVSRKSAVSISPRPIKTREMLDKMGNVIDPETKQIIKPNEENKKNE